MDLHFLSVFQLHFSLIAQCFRLFLCFFFSASFKNILTKFFVIPLIHDALLPLSFCQLFPFLECGFLPTLSLQGYCNISFKLQLYNFSEVLPGLSKSIECFIFCNNSVPSMYLYYGSSQTKLQLLISVSTSFPRLLPP